MRKLRPEPLDPQPQSPMLEKVIVQRAGRVTVFRDDETGSAAVEFALTAVPFVGLLIMIFQIGLYFFSLQALDYATRLSARKIMVGNVQSRSLTADQFKTTVLCPAIQMPLNCASITVNISVVPKISDSNAGTGIYTFIQQGVPSLTPANVDASQGSFCTGSPGDYVFIDVAYKYLNIIDFSILFGGSRSSNPMILRSTAFLVNEPYQSATGSTQSGC